MISKAFNELKKNITLTPDEEEVIKNISNLLNSVYEVQAIADLRKKIETQQELFQSANVFEYVCLSL